jgi:hypothetical protein
MAPMMSFATPRNAQHHQAERPDRQVGRNGICTAHPTNAALPLDPFPQFGRPFLGLTCCCLIFRDATWQRTLPPVAEIELALQWKLLGLQDGPHRRYDGLIIVRKSTVGKAYPTKFPLPTLSSRTSRDHGFLAHPTTKIAGQEHEGKVHNVAHFCTHHPGLFSPFSFYQLRTTLPSL